MGQLAESWGLRNPTALLHPCEDQILAGLSLEVSGFEVSPSCRAVGAYSSSQFFEPRALQELPGQTQGLEMVTRAVQRVGQNPQRRWG